MFLCDLNDACRREYLHTYERERGGGDGGGVERERGLGRKRETQRFIKWIHTCCMCGQVLVEDDSVE